MLTNLEIMHHRFDSIFPLQVKENTIYPILNIFLDL